MTVAQADALAQGDWMRNRWGECYRVQSTAFYRGLTPGVLARRWLPGRRELAGLHFVPTGRMVRCEAPGVAVAH